VSIGVLDSGVDSAINFNNGTIKFTPQPHVRLNYTSAEDDI